MHPGLAKHRDCLDWHPVLHWADDSGCRGACHCLSSGKDGGIPPNQPAEAAPATCSFFGGPFLPPRLQLSPGSSRTDLDPPPQQHWTAWREEGGLRKERQAPPGQITGAAHRGTAEQPHLPHHSCTPCCLGLPGSCDPLVLPVPLSLSSRRKFACTAPQATACTQLAPNSPTPQQ